MAYCTDDDVDDGDPVNLPAAGGAMRAVCVITRIGCSSSAVAGGKPFEHDFAISAISTVNASTPPTRKKQARAACCDRFLFTKTPSGVLVGSTAQGSTSKR